jgi:hypothetical protein
MFTTRLALRGFLVSAAVLVEATIANAEPMLLVEIHKHGFPRAAVGGPATLQFVTEITDHTTQTVFGGMYSGADEGRTFDASENLVDAFEIALSAPTGRFALTDGSHTPAGAPADWIWNMPPSSYTATQYVPRLGYGLTGYNLTRVAHRIEGFGYFTEPGPSGGPRADIRQTIALYGEPIPEPGTWSLAFICAAHISRRFLALNRSKLRSHR